MSLGTNSGFVAADSKTVQRELQKQYEVAAGAIVKRDTSSLMSIMADNLTSRRPNGQVWNRNQLQVYMNLTLGALKTIDSAKFKVVRVTTKGDEIIAFVDHTVSGTMSGNQGKVSRIVDISTDRDVWVKTSKGWRIKFTECVKEKVTLDGKIINPMSSMPAPSKTPAPTISP